LWEHTKGSVYALLDEKEKDHAEDGPEASRGLKIDSDVRPIAEDDEKKL